MTAWTRHESQRPLSWLRLTNLALGMAMLPWCVMGMITISESGKRYASRQDKYYGPKFRRGYQYLARLQYVEQNIELCPTGANTTYDLIKPFDGLPIALLIRPGKCSFREKLKFVKENVNPGGLVKYLIFDSTAYMIEGEESSADDHGFHEEGHLEEMYESNSLDYFLGIADDDDDELEEEDEELLGGRRHSNRRDTSVPQHILHVSSRTEHHLLDLLQRQSTLSYKSGGIQISMDGRIGTSVIQQSTALWISFAALMGACCCSFFLILSGSRNGWWEDPEPPAAPQPPRPQRRRLTKEQVRRLFPVYMFNGETLESMDKGAALNNVSRGTDVENGEGGGDQVLPQVPQPLELSMCSICLDDYEAGDRIRVLEPCKHAFHAKCIGRWLAERSATCPLCKMEIYDPEEEESDDEEEEEETEQQALAPPAANENRETAAQSNDFRSRFFYSFNRPTVPETDEEPPPLVEERDGREGVTSPTPSATLELDDNASSVVEQFRRPWWWRRMRRWFASRNGSINLEDTTLTLSQPLLGGEINSPSHLHPQGPLTEGNLMRPLEATLSPENTPLVTPSASLVADSVASVVPGTTAGIGNEDVTAPSSTTISEDPVPDPPGQHANSRAFEV